MRNRPAESGFTLVEISIVLVVVGLLIGGILAGRMLIRNNEVRGMLTEHQTYTMGVRLFRDKYSALPGDMPNATKFWGALNADNTLCKTLVAVGTKTCNGDGDGQVQGYTNNEKYRFWQHLSNAGLIEGSYTGKVDPNPAAPKNGTFGLNTPASRINGVGWILENDGENVNGNGDPSAPVWNQRGERFHVLILGVNYSAYDGKGGAAFTPTEAFEMDKKIDDGKPGTGIMHSTLYTKCTTGANTNAYITADYKIVETERVCGIVFPKAFSY